MNTQACVHPHLPRIKKVLLINFLFRRHDIVPKLTRAHIAQPCLARLLIPGPFPHAITFNDQISVGGRNKRCWICRVAVEL